MNKLNEDELSYLLSCMGGVIVDDETATDYRTYYHLEGDENLATAKPEDVVLEVDVPECTYRFTKQQMLDAKIEEHSQLLVRQGHFAPFVLKFFLKEIIDLEDLN